VKQRGRRGAAVLEFALAFAILAPITAASVQFIFAHVQLALLQKMVHAGAREGSALAWDSADDKPTAVFQHKVENAVLYGSTDEAANKPMLMNIRRDQIQVLVDYGEGRPRRIGVAIKGFRLLGGGAWKDLNGSPVAWFPYRAASVTP